MKKLSAVLALLICALFFVFAACEEKEEETDIPEQPEQPSVSYEVTDGEWRAALDESVLDDISYTYTMTQFGTAGKIAYRNTRVGPQPINRNIDIRVGHVFQIIIFFGRGVIRFVGGGQT